MNTRGLFSKMRGMRIVVVFLALLLAYGAVSYSPQAASSKELYSVDLGGVSGATNNTILAFGRYVVIAPFWPSKGVAENGDLDLSELDNDSLYVVDSKKPDTPPVSRKLTFWDAKLGALNRVYFPSRVLFDPASSSVYVRGTRFDENDGGEITPIDVIVYVHFTQGEDGKPVLDSSVVTIDIPGVLTERTSEAPLDLALNAIGDTLVFTNGASVFSYNLNQGYLYELPVVDPLKYGANDRISFLNIDQATNVVSICENRTSVGEDNVARVSSAISFYTLGENGTFPPLKMGFAEQFPEGTALSSGSDIAIVSDSDSQSAFFVTNDGSLCTVDLLSEGPLATVKNLHTFPELGQIDSNAPTPLLTHFDSSTRSIGIVRPGFTTMISRPTGGKPGRISRPTGIHVASAQPVLAMAKLSKKNKVTSVNAFAQDFKDEGGLSNIAIGQDSQWLISTYSGKLYSVAIARDMQDSHLQLIGSIGSRVDRLDYYADRTSLVAISSFALDEDGMRMVSPGSLVVGKISGLQSQSGGDILQALLPTASVIGRPAPSISRPCNIKR